MNNPMAKFSPYDVTRNWLGFDRLFDNFWAGNQEVNYPRYNVVKKEGNYRLELALPGWDKSELSVERIDGGLRITGRKEYEEDHWGEYLHKGLSTKSFTRSFALNDKLVVDKVSMENGMLLINMHVEMPKEEVNVIEIE